MRNNIITIALVIVIGLVAFWYLTKTDTSAGYLATDASTTNSTDAKYIYTILQQMSQVTLDDSVFVNPIFQGLKDNTVTFSPQASGRNNPFAPVGTDAAVSGQTTKPASATSTR